MHVQQVMGSVPESQRCTCTAEERAKAGGPASVWESIKRALGPRA
jgi:hypothetical protein